MAVNSATHRRRNLISDERRKETVANRGWQSSNSAPIADEIGRNWAGELDVRIVGLRRGRKRWGNPELNAGVLLPICDRGVFWPPQVPELLSPNAATTLIHMRLPLRTSLFPVLATVILFLGSAALALASDKQAPADAERAEMSETVNFIIDLGLGMGWQKFGIYTGVTGVMSILLLWPASKLVAGHGGTLKNSASYVLQTTLVGFVFIGIAIVALRAGWFKLDSASA